MDRPGKVIFIPTRWRHMKHLDRPVGLFHTSKVCILLDMFVSVLGSFWQMLYEVTKNRFHFKLTDVSGCSGGGACMHPPCCMYVLCTPNLLKIQLIR